MRSPLVVGNWKMNQSLETVKNFFKDFDQESLARRVQFGICPVSLHLSLALQTRKASVLLGAQDCHFNESGAHTGDISAAMIKELGCELVIVGHSERRADQNESSELVLKKTKAAITAGLIAIVCLGETLEEREADKTEEVVGNMVKESLKGLTAEELDSVVIAYEPVWAIGTGKTASPQQAQEAHNFIRNLLSEIFNAEVADKMRILYGGSVKPDNAVELMACPDIDGALVGGASIKADSFGQIVAAAGQNAKEEGQS
jgi:triosephosphate isomerase